VLTLSDNDHLNLSKSNSSNLDISVFSDFFLKEKSYIRPVGTSAFACHCYPLFWRQLTVLQSFHLADNGTISANGTRKCRWYSYSVSVSCSDIPTPAVPPNFRSMLPHPLKTAVSNTPIPRRVLHVTDIILYSVGYDNRTQTGTEPHCCYCP
jgi:hypothetical protein